MESVRLNPYSKKLIMGDFSIDSALFFTYWEKLFIEECLLINKHGRNNRIRKILFCKTPSSNSNRPHHRWVDWGRGYGKAPFPQTAWWTAQENISLKMKRPGGLHLIGSPNSVLPTVAQLPPCFMDTMQYEIHDIAYEYSCQKMWNLALIKPEDLISAF